MEICVPKPGKLFSDQSLFQKQSLGTLDPFVHVLRLPANVVSTIRLYVYEVQSGSEEHSVRVSSSERCDLIFSV